MPNNDKTAVASFRFLFVKINGIKVVGMRLRMLDKSEALIHMAERGFFDVLDAIDYYTTNGRHIYELDLNDSTHAKLEFQHTCVLNAFNIEKPSVTNTDGRPNPNTIVSSVRYSEYVNKLTLHLTMQSGTMSLDFFDPLPFIIHEHMLHAQRQGGLDRPPLKREALQ